MDTKQKYLWISVTFIVVAALIGGIYLTAKGVPLPPFLTPILVFIPAVLAYFIKPKESKESDSKNEEK